MSKINEGIEILEAMGLPRTQQNERSSLTLLALLDLRKNTLWSKSRKRIIRIHDILMFIRIGKSRIFPHPLSSLCARISALQASIACVQSLLFLSLKRQMGIISKIELTNTCGFICLTKTQRWVKSILYKNLQYFHLWEKL